MDTQDSYQDIRDAIKDLCAQFPDEYHRKVDHDRTYPEAFVDALTQAGWLAALIPTEYGGSGLGLAEASAAKSFDDEGPTVRAAAAFDAAFRV